ncbi:MarR family transcriptional regulator [Christensenellaceae bacterium OttesenSCG-928-K19]|nr:MarR family transcriptional regulator [Christensenellaceae bacterium OttesenSCG-928-K19]
MDISKIIARAHRLSHISIAHALKGMDIKPGLYMYVLCICDHGGISQEELAAELLVDKSSAAKAVKLLIADGFIDRKQNEQDKRAYHLYPSPKAKEYYPIIQKARESAQKELLSGMTPVEADFFIRLLEKLNVERKFLTASDESLP